MIRLDRQRLEHAIFPETITVPTRFDDLDLQRHVNNVAVSVLFQEGRSRFNQARMAGFFADGGGVSVGSQFIDFAGQMFWPDPVEVLTGVLEIGRSSYVLGQIIRQQGRVTAFAEVALVSTGPGGSAPLTDAARAALEEARVVPA